MKIRNVKNQILTIGSYLMFILLSSCSENKEKTTDKVTEKGAEVIEEIKESVKETSLEIKDFTVDSKDQALEAVKKSLSKIDSEINDFEIWLKEKGSSLSSASKEKYEFSIVSLKAQRDKLSEWATKMENATAESWEELKKGYFETYETFKKLLKDAKDSITD